MSRPCFWLAPLALLLALAPATSADDVHDLFDGKSLDGWVVEGPAKGKTGRTMWSSRTGGSSASERHSVFSDTTAGSSPISPCGSSTGLPRSREPTRKATAASVSGRDRSTPSDRGKPAPHTRPLRYSCSTTQAACLRRHGTGSLYRYKSPTANPARPAPEWNTIEVECAGPRITVRLNGQTVLEADQSELADVKTRPAGVAAPKDKPRRGYVALQSHSGRVEFRKVQIRE